MYNSKKIREDIAAIMVKAKALNALAEAEERELTPEEQTEFEGLLAQVGNDGSDGEAKSGFYAKLDTAEKYEAIQANLAKPANSVAHIQNRQAGEPGNPVKAIRKRYNLKAYKPEQTEDAYRAGRWVAAALFGHSSSVQWCRDNGIDIQAAQTEGDNSKGGFLVPSEMSQAIIDLREAYGVFRRHARNVRMGSDAMSIPRRLSGVTAYAVGENDAITASDKSWDQVELVAKKWGVLVRYSSELDEDAFIDLADDLASEMAYAFALKEDQSGFIGDGTSTYHGVSGLMVKVSDGNHAGGIYTAASGNTAFSTLDMVDFEGALGQVPQYAIDRGNAAWFISRVGFYQSMARLVDAAGGNSLVDLGNGPSLNFLGLPVVISQVLNSTTTAQTDTNIAAVGDLSLAATIGSRRDFSVAVSSDRYFENDELAIRGTQRTAINVHDLGDATDAGPVVVLRTPGS